MLSIKKWVTNTAITLAAIALVVVALVSVLTGIMLDQEDTYLNYYKALIASIMDAYNYLLKDPVYQIMDTVDQEAILREVIEHALKAAFNVIPEVHHDRLLKDVINHMTKVTTGEIP